MDSYVPQNQQLPQQPSPLDAVPPQVAQAQTQMNDPGGTDTSSAYVAPTQQTAAVPDQQEQQVEAPQPATRYNNESALLPGVQKPQPEEILFEWQAPSRPFKQRNRQYFTTISLIAALTALILLFAGQLFFVAVIAAVIFVVYVLNTTAPGLITHKLSTYGIRVENTLYYWEEMGSFWFTEKHGQNILNIEIARFPNRLVILLGTTSKEDMTTVLSEVLLNQQPPPTTYEKAAQWLQEKLPIDIES